MATRTSYGHVNATGTISSFQSGDFTITKRGTNFFLTFTFDASETVINVTAESLQNFDPPVAAVIDRDGPSVFQIAVVQISNGAARNDRGFWFHALSPN